MFEFEKIKIYHYMAWKNRGLFLQKIEVFFLKKIEVFFFANRPLQGFNPLTKVYWKITYNLHRHKNEARGQRIRKGQTPLQAELRQAKNTSQKKCFPLPLESIKHFLWPAPSLRGWVRNQYTARPNSSRIHAKQNAVEEPMRTARTAAGFEPMFVPKVCKTQARKKASQKRCVRNPSTRCRNCSFETVKKNTGKGP